MDIIEITNVDTWENFIFKHSPQSFFQSWCWGAISNSQLRKPTLWKLGFLDNKKLIGIALIKKIVAKRGTYVHIRHGPILADWSKSSFKKCIEIISNRAIDEGAQFIRVSPLLENTESNKNLFSDLGFIDSPIHQLDGEYCWVLDINKSKEELLAGMRKTTRYLIKQAQKMEIRIEKTTDEHGIDDFMKLYKLTAQRHGFIPHKGIREEFLEFKKTGNVQLYKGYYENKLVSVAMIVFYNHQGIYHHSASIAGKVPVNYLLQWEAIQESINRGKKVYNFWGVAPEGIKRHPWNGLSLFKKGFGGRVVEYLHAKDLPLSKRYYLTYTYEQLRKAWKGY